LGELYKRNELHNHFIMRNMVVKIPYIVRDFREFSPRELKSLFLGALIRLGTQ
jgi:hypothetical protein